MGIIKAATGSVGGVMADQWLEVYTCNSIPERYLSVRAEKKTGERSSNTKGEENVISDGSTVIVHPGQCALAIDKGKVTGVFDQPGENVYHTDRSPSIFHKGGLKGVLRQSFDRFGYGGLSGHHVHRHARALREPLRGAHSAQAERYQPGYRA